MGVDPDSSAEHLTASIIAELTGMSQQETLEKLRDVAIADSTISNPEVKLQNLVEAAPMRPASRQEALDKLNRLHDLPAHVLTSNCGRAIEVLRRSPIAIPERTGVTDLAPQPNLDTAITCLSALDRDVPQPWTLIGGFMTQVHCSEFSVPSPRVTDDIDIAVSVFTHRDALRAVTGCLTRLGFADVSPIAGNPRAQMSYRWMGNGVTIDVVVPEKANDQDRPPRTVSLRPAPELPGLQQAIMRTERLQVATSTFRGSVRRPDLLGAVVVKSVAAVSDTRDRGRHHSDLVALGSVGALHPDLAAFARQASKRDQQRIGRALVSIPKAMWASQADPDAARDALVLLSGR